MKILALFAIIAMTSKCNTYDNTLAAARLQLPGYTETGANTFGCLVNGETWTNFGQSWIKGSVFGGHLDTNRIRSYINYKSDTVFFISGELTISKDGSSTRDEGLSINVTSNNRIVKGVHRLTSAEFLVDYQDFIRSVQYFSFKRNPFTVTINKDSIAGNKHIVSGTFSGTLYTFPQTDSIRIVGGTFDVTVR